MPKPYPGELRDDVVAVARKGQAPLNEVLRRAAAYLSQANLPGK